MFLYILLFLTVILTDILTKHYINVNFFLGESVGVIGDFIKITFVKNTGIAFGMFQDMHKYLMYLTPAAVIILFIIFLKTSNKNFLIKTGFVLILSGAVGNLIDRFYYGYVVDFIDVDFFNISINSFKVEFMNFFFNGYEMTRWPTFNIADSSISIGIFLLVIEPLFYRNKGID